MRRNDFFFDLPQNLVAQYPSDVRGTDRVMTLERATGAVAHRIMDDLPRLIPRGTVMVFNNSRVRKSRVFAVCEDGGIDNTISDGKKAEFLFIEKRSESGNPRWKVMVKNAKKHKNGTTYRFPDGTRAVLAENPEYDNAFRDLVFLSATSNSESNSPSNPPIDENWFERNGHIPLPPYIKRSDSALDGDRYQTVYAKETGSAACPTAGLHFTDELLERLAECGIERAWVTLHVGLGTFLPVRADNIEDHQMHRESFSITAECAEKVNAAKREGRPVLAVGTTSVRTLESAWHEEAGKGDGIVAGSGTTNIFIYPGYRFRVIDALFTNFHTSESTLLMLASAFAGKERLFAAYNEAIRCGYRFFSYGDAMLIQ